MEKISFIATTVIIISVLSGVIAMLFPDKKPDKITETVLAGVMLITVITTVKSAKLSELFTLDISAEQQISEEISEKSDRYAEAIIKRKTAQLVSQKLGESNFSANKISVIADRNENGDIYIREVNVSLDDKCKDSRQTIKRILQSYLGNQVILNID